MIAAMHERFLTVVAAALFLVLLRAGMPPALAGEGTRHEQARSLPGVDLPEGELARRSQGKQHNPASAAPARRHGSVGVGNWDVRISGSISCEIGFGRRPPRR